MIQSNILIESCTLHDDQYLTYHDLHENSNESEAYGSKSHLCAGGYSYTIRNDNRFVIWRIIGNKLELIEQSSVYNLYGNCKRIFFKNAMIIPKVLIYKHVNESHYSSSIVVLIATTSKLYRLICPINSESYNSIFFDISSADLANIDPANCYQINLSSVDYGDIHVTSRGEALFGFIFQNSSICCVQMPPINQRDFNSEKSTLQSSGQNHNLPFKVELNQPNLVKRLWSGITRAAQDNQSIFISFKFFSQNETTYLIGLCKDFKIKLWCLKTNQCIHIEELSKYIKADGNITWEQSKIEVISYQKHSITTILITTNDQFKMCSLKLDLSKGVFSISEISKRIIKKNGHLLDMSLTNFNTWLMYKNEKENIEITTIPIYENNETSSKPETFIINLQSKTQNKHKLSSGGSFDDNHCVEDDENEDDEEDGDHEKLIDFANMDLKETYLKLIFEPYKFSRYNILKSLGILRHSILNETHSNLLTIDEIKELIIKSIEKEVQSHPNFSNVTEEEFLYLNSKCWSKFYTMLKQYDFESRIPLGLFVDSNHESHIILIRKGSVSLMTSADLSQFYHLSQIDLIKSFYYNTLKGKVDSEANDLFHLLSSVRCINEYYSSLHPSILSSNSSNEVDMSYSITNYKYINMITDSLTLTNKDFLSDFCSYLFKINNVDNFYSLLGPIFKYFDLNRLKKMHDLGDSYIDSQMETDNDSIFISSEFTLDTVMANFRDLVSNRYEFFRNLSIFINIIFRFNDKIQISRQLAEEIYHKYFEISFNYLNSYYFLKWLTDIYPINISKNQMEKSNRRTIDLIEDIDFDHLKETNINEIILKSFAKSYGRFILNNRQISLQSKLNDLLFYLTNNVLNFTWPISSDTNFELVRYLIYNSQFLHLYNYCSKTKWWSNVKNLRYFLLAHCCLFFENIDQSTNLFLKASYNLEKDQNLKKFMKLKSTNRPTTSNQMEKTYDRRSIILPKKSNYSSLYSRRDSILNESNIKSNLDYITINNMDDENAILLDYYTKVIHYYDLNGNIEASIELIQNGLLKCQFDSSSTSKLYCILFKSYMDLEYYEKAHMALMSNFDMEWKKTCLKHFISELCNQNKTSIIVGFEYGDMLQDVLNIIYKRAQSSDLRTNDFYKVLYSIYIKNKDYRKAAFCMYECAFRLKFEINGISSLKRQEKCYLTCMNLLKLVDKKFAWLVVPFKLDEFSSTAQTSNIIKSPKRMKHKFEECRHVLNELDVYRNSQNEIDNDMLPLSATSKEFCSIDKCATKFIVDLDEINKNYLIVTYMIKLSTIMSNQSTITSFYSVDELINILVKYGLFDDAITLCLAFKSTENSPLVNILLSLTDRCCNFNHNFSNESKEITNDFYSEFEMIKNNDSFSFALTPYENPSSFKWKLLHSYLKKFNDVVYYKSVCKRIIILETEIPHYIIDSFKKLNSNSLLQIYITYGFWQEAVDLVNQYIEAVLIDGGAMKHFDLIDSLKPNKLSSVIFPYSLVDNLVISLSKSKDPDLINMNEMLRNNINAYLDQIKMATESLINLKR